MSYSDPPVYTIKIPKLYVNYLYGYAFRRAMRYGAETWHGGIGDGPTRFENIFSKQPDQRSKVIQGKVALEMPYGHKESLTEV